MKKTLLFAFMAVAALVSCKKEKTPAAAFSVSKTNYYLTENISFNNTSTNASSYTWDFGDGTTSALQSPQHAYTTSGVYHVKLTVAGNATPATSTVKVYNGTASYEVDNNTTLGAFDLVSFAADANNNLIDFKDHGVIAIGAKSDTVFTKDASIYIGGVIGTQAFIVDPAFTIAKYTHNKLALTNTSQIYSSGTTTGTSIKTPVWQNMLHGGIKAQSIKKLETLKN
jgi:PKD repeat protein